MLPHAEQNKMAAIKRRLEIEIRNRFPMLAPLCRISSLFRGGTVICLSRPTYPEPDRSLEEFLGDYRAMLTNNTIFDLAAVPPVEWRAVGVDGGGVAPDSCEFLSDGAKRCAVTSGSNCYFYSRELLESQRSRWPANSPLPPQYWEHRRYINEQYQLLCRWIELFGQDGVPEIDDVSPSMVAVTETPR